MTTTIAQKVSRASGAKVRECPRAIVRSVFDDPSVLRVVGHEGTQVVVASEDGRHMIAVPSSRVFGFSGAALETVEDALAGGDPKVIASAWASLDPYED